MTIIRESVEIGGKELTLETGRMAKQASGSVLVQYGDTVVLVTVADGGPRDLPFFPLTCEYVEKSYAAGRIPASYFRREGRQSELETLICRLIDRPVRPLFPKGYKNDTQVIATVLSADKENTADVNAITGASAALMLSSIPWDGPIAGIRVGRINGEFVANPTMTQRAESSMDIVIACSKDAILMVEGAADEASDEVMLEALDFGFQAAQPVLELQLKLREAVGRPKVSFTAVQMDAEVLSAVTAACEGGMREALFTPGKFEKRDAIDAFKKQVVASLAERFAGREGELKEAFEKVLKKTVRSIIIKEKKRVDGRGPADIRTISTEVGVLPRVHGSSLFTRGETQALAAATLGTERDNQRIDTLEGTETREFMLHYNFPPFSVGEVKPLRGTGRREIGHGALARRALLAVIPKTGAEWPYVIRVVSEVLESNGSSSMATVCSASMAMMDAGVPLKAPVAGIAMGLIKEGDDIEILSDILGEEDHLGDMDFKVCGTATGITAFQLDTKISGVSRETMMNALRQAREGRVHILSRMAATISSSRKEMSPYAPRIVAIKIKPSQIGAVIGGGGRTIRGISEQTGAQIDISDDGTVTIATSDEAMARKAIDMIKNLTQEPEVGQAYMGTVKKIVDFGAFIEILPGCEGLCHISELTEGRVDRVEDVLKEGEEVLVKCIGIDRSGKIKLSRREALADQGRS